MSDGSNEDRGKQKYLVQGFFIGVSFTILAPISVTWEIVESFLKEWQTLVTGFIALFAAFLAYRGVDKGIANSKKNFDEKVKIDLLNDIKQETRKETVVRAKLPHSLSYICEYAGAYFDNIQGFRISNGSRRQYFAPELEFDEAYVDKLAEMIEYGPEQLSLLLAMMLHSIQIFRSRYQSFTEAGNRGLLISDHQKHHAMADATEMYTLASSLFEYARFENKDLSDVSDQFDRAIQGLPHQKHIWKDDNAEFYNVLEKRKGKVAAYMKKATL